jgi:hypothetical protein
MRRIALSLLAVAIVILTVAGSAATLGLASTDLGAGQASVAPCGDTSGVTRNFATSAGEVTRIDLSGFPAGCEGGAARVVITDASGAAVSSGGPVVISGGAASITLSPTLNPSSVRTAHVVVAGP